MGFQDIQQTVIADIPSRLPGVIGGERLFLVPAAAAGISLVILLLHCLFSLDAVTGFLEHLEIAARTPKKTSPPGIGNGAILRFRIARLLG